MFSIPWISRNEERWLVIAGEHAMNKVGPMILLFQFLERASGQQTGKRNSGKACFLIGWKDGAGDPEERQRMGEMRAAQKEKLGDLQRVPLKSSAGGIPVRKPQVARKKITQKSRRNNLKSLQRARNRSFPVNSSGKTHN